MRSLKLCCVRTMCPWLRGCERHGGRQVYRATRIKRKRALQCSRPMVIANRMKLNPKLAEILSPAYGRCPRFSDACAEMRWCPEQGHVPRGFAGACHDLSEVELVLVSAEPGDPWPDECHSGLESAYEYTIRAFAEAPSKKSREFTYHKNMRWILDRCWPSMPFEHQLRKVWITDSVLCSAVQQGGSVSKKACMACGNHYLLPQLKLFPEALIVAVGSKARDRLRALGVSDFLAVWAVAPPGCNSPKARKSWEDIVVRLRERQKTFINSNK